MEREPLSMSLIDWIGYEPYVPPFPGSLQGMPRRQALECYKDVIDRRAQRVEFLRGLLRANGVSLGSDDSSIQKLNDWVWNNVEPAPSGPEFLRNLWYSVAFDTGIFLGEVMIERAPVLHWEMFINGKRNVSYQRPVLMGFSQAADRRFNFDGPSVVVSQCHRIVAGMEVPSDFFVHLVKYWVNLA